MDDTPTFERLTDGTIHGALELWLSFQTQALAIYGPIGDWDVSAVTDMSFLFANRFAFNDDINRWDVSNVTTMKDMFSYAETFNQPLATWDVSRVVNMHRMFAEARSFNQSLATWAVTNVIDMVCLQGVSISQWAVGMCLR
jgi:hypothetical protein